MKRSLLSGMVPLLLLYNVHIYAQDKFSKEKISLGASAEAAVPTGKFSDISHFGIGANIEGKYAFSEKINFISSAGFLNFFGRSVDYTSYDNNGGLVDGKIKAPDSRAIVLRFGASWFLTNMIFVKGTVGPAFLNNDAGTAFAYSPALGLQFDKLDVEVRYEGWAKSETLSFVGVKAAYYFRKF